MILTTLTDSKIRYPSFFIYIVYNKKFLLFFREKIWTCKKKDLSLQSFFFNMLSNPIRSLS